MSASASEATALWRYRSFIIIIIIMLWPLSVVLVANTNGRLAIPALAGLLVLFYRLRTPLYSLIVSVFIVRFVLFYIQLFSLQV